MSCPTGACHHTRSNASESIIWLLAPITKGGADMVPPTVALRLESVILPPDLIKLSLMVQIISLSEFTKLLGDNILSDYNQILM